MFWFVDCVTPGGVVWFAGFCGVGIIYIFGFEVCVVVGGVGVWFRVGLL